MTEYQTVRGMRDFLPDDMAKRNYVFSIVKGVFSKYGFEEMETPAIENLELLSSKEGAGEEVRKEVYRFKDQGGRELGLRFDLTVPTARVVASNPDLPKPFKRFMIGRVWRYDRPGAGRYREFWQADVDVFGSESALADAECAASVCEVLSALEFDDFSIKVNNRKLLEALAVFSGIKENSMSVFRSVDKLDKIGKEGVADELEEKGILDDNVKKFLDLICVEGGRELLCKFEELLGDKTDGIAELRSFLEQMKLLGFEERVVLQPSLARGLDYYTGNVFECAVQEGKWSIAGGGRYDKLIQSYGGREVPAVGISIGIERVITLMEERFLFPDLQGERVFVAPVKDEVREKALELVQELRSTGIIAETDLMGRKLGKQFAYVDSRGIKTVLVVGPKELEDKEVTVRDMESGNEERVALSDLISFLKRGKEED